LRHRRPAHDARPVKEDIPMITLHRYHRDNEQIHLNPDLIALVEARPDTVVNLTTGQRLLVRETPDQVNDAVRNYRTRLLADALNLQPV
jgi:flagellar protein FlbD